jgi:hypothetical protein
MARRTISKAKIKLPRELEELVQWAINGGDLAPRVHDVLRAAMLRMTIAETANALDLSEQSVKAYRWELCIVFGVSRVTDLVHDLLLSALGVPIASWRRMAGTRAPRRLAKRR